MRPVVVAGYGQQGETAARPGAMGIMQHGHNYVVEAGVGELRVDGKNRRILVSAIRAGLFLPKSTMMGRPPLFR